MSKKTEKIRAELLKLIAATRKKIDPKILARAQKIAEAQLQEMGVGIAPKEGKGGAVPYDQEAAKTVVERFLLTKQGNDEFIRELKKRLSADGQSSTPSS